MTLLLIGDALRALGAPGWAVLLAVVGVGLYHFRHVLGIAATAAFVLKLLAFVVAFAVFAAGGYVPGVELDVNISVVVDTLEEPVRAAWRLVQWW